MNESHREISCLRLSLTSKCASFANMYKFPLLKHAHVQDTDAKQIPHHYFHASNHIIMSGSFCKLKLDIVMNYLSCGPCWYKETNIISSWLFCRKHTQLISYLLTRREGRQSVTIHSNSVDLTAYQTSGHGSATAAHAATYTIQAYSYSITSSKYTRVQPCATKHRNASLLHVNAVMSTTIAYERKSACLCACGGRREAALYTADGCNKLNRTKQTQSLNDTRFHDTRYNSFANYYPSTSWPCHIRN